METNVNYTLVGAFIIGLLTFAVLAIIWLSSGFSFQHYTKYMIYMKESVSGLNIDSPVEFNGVNVGTVSTIQLNHKNPELVEVILKVNSTTPITQGTVATLATRGITGITYVALKDKSTDLRPLVAVDDQPYPVIKTAPSLFMRLDTILNELSTNFREVTQSIRSVLDKENLESFKIILANMRSVSNNLAQNNKRFNQILENTSKATAQFGPMLQSSTSTVRVLETQTLPATYQLINNLNEMTRNLNQVTIELKQNPSAIIRGPATPQLGPGEVK